MDCSQLSIQVFDVLPVGVQGIFIENDANESMEHFKQELIEYLDYYNNHRIKAKLKGLPPALHRQQALSLLEQFLLSNIV